jgi:F0F1-type ATP synthase assembly protein I
MQSVANSAFSHTLRKILLVQIGLVLVAAAILTLVKGHEFFIATLYGGVVVIAGTIYFGWRLKIATEAVDNAPSVNSVELFKGIVVRFLIVIVLLALGLGWFKLAPAGILSGFIVAQLAFWFSRSSYGVTRRK